MFKINLLHGLVSFDAAASARGASMLHRRRSNLPSLRLSICLRLSGPICAVLRLNYSARLPTSRVQHPASLL